MPIRLVIVDDSTTIRQLLRSLLAGEKDILIVGEAEDPIEAREVIKRTNPDVITLDIEMPKMDGLDFLEKIMRLRPMPVIMLSSLTQKGGDATIRALELGAVDCIAKATAESVTSPEALKTELVQKIHMAAKARIQPRGGVPVAVKSRFDPAKACRNLIAIGASTGGVEALRVVLQSLPGNLPPIVITQHMPPRFTTSFAARLDSVCEMATKEAEHGEILREGTAYIAPGGRHFEVKRSGEKYKAFLHDGDLVSGHRPSVDVLFGSVAEAAGELATAAILTGMGSDGAKGMKKLRDRGALTFGQNEATCVVYGMPKAAKAADGVGAEYPLEAIGGHLIAALQTARAKGHVA